MASNATVDCDKGSLTSSEARRDCFCGVTATAGLFAALLDNDMSQSSRAEYAIIMFVTKEDVLGTKGTALCREAAPHPLA